MKLAFMTYHPTMLKSCGKIKMRNAFIQVYKWSPLKVIGKYR